MPEWTKERTGALPSEDRDREFESRGNALAVGAGQKGEGPREAALAALRVVDLLVGSLDALLAGDAEDIVLDNDLGVLLVNARQLDGNGVVPAVLPNLDLQYILEGAQRPAPASRATRHAPCD